MTRWKLKFTTPIRSRADSDYDGLNDGVEISLGTDPLNPDTDWDDLLDGAEQAAGSSPLIADSDMDGLADGQDPWPIDADYDDDGLLDGEELVDGSNGSRLEVEDFAQGIMEHEVPWHTQKILGGIAPAFRWGNWGNSDLVGSPHPAVLPGMEFRYPGERHPTA